MNSLQISLLKILQVHFAYKKFCPIAIIIQLQLIFSAFLNILYILYFRLL